MRQLITAGDEIVTMALSPEAADVSQLLDKVQSKIYAIDERSNRGKKGFVRLPEVATEVTKEIQALYEQHRTNDVTGLPTSYVKLDKMLTGLHKGDLVVVAGRPSMGKTAFALNIAEYAGMVLQLPVAIFSMEMSAEQLTNKKFAVPDLMNPIGRTLRKQSASYPKPLFTLTTHRVFRSMSYALGRDASRVRADHFPLLSSTTCS